MKYFFALLTGFVLSCSAYSATDGSGITVEASEFSPTLLVTGKRHSEGEAGNKKIAYLSSEVNRRTGHNQYTLNLVDTYRGAGFHHWDSAVSDQGSALETIRVQTDIACRGQDQCVYIEAVAVVLPPELLLRALKDPIRLQVVGASVNYIYTFDPDEVSLFLQAEGAARLTYVQP